MNAGILPQGAQDAVFDIIQGQRLILNTHQVCPPGVGGEQAWRDIDVLNGRYRHVIQHRPHGLGVVQIDPEGELLVPVQAADRHRLQQGQIVIQLLRGGLVKITIAH